MLLLLLLLLLQYACEAWLKRRGIAQLPEVYARGRERENVRDSAFSHRNKTPKMEDGETVEVAPGASSVETNCPICLEEMDNKSFLDTCFHILLGQVHFAPEHSLHIWNKAKVQYARFVHSSLR